MTRCSIEYMDDDLSIQVKFPYNKYLVKLFRTKFIPSKWDKNLNSWTVPKTYKHDIEIKLKHFYEWEPGCHYETVTIMAKETIKVHELDNITLNNYPIARVLRYKNEPVVCEGVCLVEGSIKHYKGERVLVAPKGTIFSLDVPAKLNINSNSLWESLIFKEYSTKKVKTLEEERSQLLKRLLVIEQLISANKIFKPKKGA